MIKEIVIPIKEWKKQLKSCYEYVEKKGKIPENVNQKFISDGVKHLSELIDEEKDMFWYIEKMWMKENKNRKTVSSAPSMFPRTRDYLKKRRS